MSMNSDGFRRETGPRPLVMRSQDDRGPACQAAVERSEAAQREVSKVLGDNGVLIGDAGQLAAVAAALPPETAVFTDTRIWICGDGEPGDGKEWVTAVAAMPSVSARPPATPVRDSHGTGHDVMQPALLLGTVLLPGPGAPLIQSDRAWGTWDTLMRALDYEESSGCLAAASAVLARVADLLTDDEGRPGGVLPEDHPIVGHLRVLAAKVADSGRERALEEAEATWGDREPPCPQCGSLGYLNAMHDGTPAWSCDNCGHVWAGPGRLQVSLLDRLAGCDALTDPALQAALQPPGGTPALGAGEAWNYREVRAAYNGTLKAMLAIRGITWEPGEAHAALTPGMTAGDAAAIWRKARNLAATHLGAITAEATDGRPAGEAIRPEDAPGRRWVTARRDWAPRPPAARPASPAPSSTA